MKRFLFPAASLALQVGLPAEPGAVQPFSDFSWSSTPHLRLSREGFLSGQLIVSSGPPLRTEMARQRQHLGRPASWAGVERMFSKAGRLHDDLKASQSDDTLEHALLAAANLE